MKNTLRILIILALVVSTIWLAPSGKPENVSAATGWVGAAYSSYIGSTATQPMDINVSNDGSSSMLGQDRQLVLDSNGYPHIVWIEEIPTNNFEILYVHWNGANWECANGDDYAVTSASANLSNSVGWSYNPSLALDSNDNPHISWDDVVLGNPNPGIFYVHWNGNNWECANGDDYAVIPTSAIMSNNIGLASFAPSLALDSGDNPHITWQSFFPPSNYEIIYAYWNGSNWQCANGDNYTTTPTSANVSNNGGSSHHPSLALDSGNNPHVAWQDHTPGNYEIFYVRWNDINWECANGDDYSVTSSSANVSSNSGDSYNPSLVSDNSDNPYITWSDPSYGNIEILYVHWNGTNWQCANGDNYTTTPTSANVSNNGGSSHHPSLALDSGNNPHVAWQDHTPGNYEIFYVRWNDINWECANGDDYAVTPGSASVSRSISLAFLPSLVLHNSDNPHVVWLDNSEIFYVHWYVFDGIFTISKSVDTNGDGNFIDENVRITLDDTITYRVELEKLTGTDPLYYPYVYDTIPDGAKYISGSVIPVVGLEYSDDFGLTWSLGEPPADSPGGTMLRWRITDCYPAISGHLLTAEFSVFLVDENIKAINNTAYFIHRNDDLSNFLASNTISNTTIDCENGSGGISSPYLEITKTAGSMHYYKNDLFTFKARVGNIGGKEATNVTLTDNFPREMEIVGSRPKGIMSNGKWSYNVGTLTPGQGRIFDFIFRLKSNINLGENPLSLTNIITATSGETDSVTDNATIVVRNHIGTESLTLFTNWSGIDTKTFEGKAGEEITLSFKATGGSSPYDISVNWGDGETSKFFDIPGDMFKEAFHTFSDSGEFEVIIKVVDQFGKTVLSWVTLNIK